MEISGDDGNGKKASLSSLADTFLLGQSGYTSYKSASKTSMFCSNLSSDLPVDPPRPFLRFDVDIIVIDINLGNLNLEVVGKEPDGFPHRAKAGTPWRLKQRRRGRRA